MSRLRSALAVLVLILATGLMGGLILLVCRKPPRPALAHRLSRLWGRALLAACWGRLKVTGTNHLDPAASYVFVSNHQSALDIPVLLAALPQQFGFLAKRELFELKGLKRPFSRVMVAGGHIPVDREEDAKVRPMVRGATEKLARGESIVVFPEGTRSPTAEMLPFKKGAFLIAHHSGRPVVPVAIIGTRSILPPTRQIWLGPPGTVRVVIGAPIASQGKRIAELAQEVRERIIANCSGVAAPGSINKE